MYMLASPYEVLSFQKAAVARRELVLDQENENDAGQELLPGDMLLSACQYQRLVDYSELKATLQATKGIDLSETRMVNLAQNAAFQGMSKSGHVCTVLRSSIWYDLFLNRELLIYPEVVGDRRNDAHLRAS